MIGMLLSLALALGGILTDVQPGQGEPIVVTNRADQQRLVMLGFVAFGSDEDLDRLEAAASAISARNGRIDNNPGERLETMVVFGRTDRSDAMRLYRDAAGGRYGRLTVEAMVIRAADARDGIDPDEIRMTAAANIVED